MIGRTWALGLVLMAGVAAAAPAPSPFRDALAVWHMAGRDSMGRGNSRLEPSGDVRLGVALPATEAEDSRRRGGDGRVAELSGGWLSAGQGVEGVLNPDGEALTVLARVRDPRGTFRAALFNKHGGHDRLVYNLFTWDLTQRGAGTYLGFELGTAAGMAQVAVPVAALPDPGAWHDVIARYTGRRLELWVDGVLRDARPASGRLRTGNLLPVMIGTEPQGAGFGLAFRGSIDHIALWDRALADAEVVQLSGGDAEVVRARAEVKTMEETRERTVQDRLASDPQRPLYHFLPPRNWMNDPNGLIQYHGEYHMFFQHNPFGPLWGNMTWGHAVSRDLVRWKDLPHALHPDQPYDKGGVFSGCMVVNDGVPTAVYTGVSPEVQCIATSSDPDLLTWTKHPANPVIAGPPHGMPVTGFRDPCVWREGDAWYAVIGSGTKERGGSILLYRSPDLVRWEYLHPALEAVDAPALGGKEKLGEMWECPNFFPLGKKWVLLLSPIPLGRSIYMVGEYRNQRFVPEREGELDPGGTFYAPQAFRDEQGRRLMFGWLREQRPEAHQAAAGWSGCMTLPRVLTLADDGRLVQTPAPEVERLRGKSTRFRDLSVKPERAGLLDAVRGDALELEASVETGDAERWGLLLRQAPGALEVTRLTVDVKGGRLELDTRGGSETEGVSKEIHSVPLEIRPGEPVKLRVFVDRSVIEVYANGVCLTSRVYPGRSDSLGVDLWAAGGTARVKELTAWTMRPARNGR
jgi:beta-fructofuranosidase